MEWLFGRRKTPAGKQTCVAAYNSCRAQLRPMLIAMHAAEILRENKRMLDKAIRELDRERMGLQNQEKKTIAEIKKMAKEGQMVMP